MGLLDRTPLAFFAVLALAMGLAPFHPQPHLVEKLSMLWAGQLSRPIDIFDLLWHGLFPALLIVKLLRMQYLKKHASTGSG